MEFQKQNGHWLAEGLPRAHWLLEWARADGQGKEQFGLYAFDTEPGWGLQGWLDFPVGERHALWIRYIVQCDAKWRTRRLLLASAQNPLANQLVKFPVETPLFILSADGEGNWRVGDEDRPDLRGCLDVDLGCSPSTNTLPIRRLNLAIGESAEVTAAWVRFPDLSVQPLRQRYTRFASDRYRYESLESDFTADLTVDDLGLVVDYPGGWRRKVG